MRITMEMIQCFQRNDRFTTIGKLFLAVHIGLLICSCGKTKQDIHAMSMERFANHIVEPSSGYTKQKSMGEFEMTCSYKPAVIHTTDKTEWGTTTYGQAYRSLAESSHNEYPFSVRLRLAYPGFGEELLKYGASDISVYSARVHYYAYDVKKKATVLFDNGEKLEPIDHHWVRTYKYDDGIVIDFIFFSKSFELKDFIFMFEDDVFETGIHKFRFDVLDL